MSKVGGGGGSAFMKLRIIYIHSEYIQHRLIITFFMTTSNFGGAQPPLSKSGGAQAPPAPPGSLPLCKMVNFA